MATALTSLAGTLLDGRYRLTQLIGQGGMGAVYEAEDLRLTRRVAIKLLRPAHDDSRLGERLFREARAAARSDHPAVITVYGFGVDVEQQLNYLAMERLAGETLAERCARSGPMPIPFVLELAHDLLDALRAVHTANVVHRDLKPSNVFLHSRGRRIDEVKLLDFGVARLLDLQTLTATGELYGTPMYMAPEQLRDSRRADARSDLYSLGLVLHECLTGRPRFAATDLVALTHAILAGGPANVAAARPDCPAALARLIERCTRVRSDERFQHAEEAIATLLD